LTISATNYFVVRFLPRVRTPKEISLSPRQTILMRSIQSGRAISTSEAAGLIGASADSALRELRFLQDHGIVVKEGNGRSTRYGIAG
jgi:predicted transcriptional regulator